MFQRNRGVKERGRPQPFKVGCPIRACDGILYKLKPGEYLSRLPRVGRTMLEKTVQCDSCDHRQKLNVMSRPTAEVEE